MWYSDDNKILTVTYADGNNKYFGARPARKMCRYHKPFLYNRLLSVHFMVWTCHLNRFVFVETTYSSVLILQFVVCYFQCINTTIKINYYDRSFFTVYMQHNSVFHRESQWLTATKNTRPSIVGLVWTWWNFAMPCHVCGNFAG